MEDEPVEMDISVSTNATKRPAEAHNDPTPESRRINNLIVLHLNTAGAQDEQAGSDEYPIVLITAKRVDLDAPETDHPEFQCLVRPYMITAWQKENATADVQPENDTDANETIGRLMDQVDEGVTEEPRDGDGCRCFCCASNYSNVLLSTECERSLGLTDDMLVGAPCLAEALELFDSWIKNQDLCVHGSEQDTNFTVPAEITNCNPSSTESIKDFSSQGHPEGQQPICNKKARHGEHFQFLVDGPASLRTMLHAEAARKSINLTKFPYLYQYIDLRKSLKKFQPADAETMNVMPMAMAADLDRNIDTEYTNRSRYSSLPMGTDDDPKGDKYDLMTREMIYNETESSDVHLSMGQTTNNTPGYRMIEYCRQMAELAVHLHRNGANWDDVETINRTYQPAIVRITEQVDDNTVVRARGLPWQATDMDISNFFGGLNITDGGICLVLSEVGRRNGEALIRFVDSEQRDLALRRHKQHMGQRYIEVYPAQGKEFIRYAGAETMEAEQFLRQVTSARQAVIRMRGLPYSATAEQIIQFFQNSDCPVQFGENGVLFVNRCDGRATGDAFVLFESQAVAEQALKNHKKHIGNRYIELFKSTPAEVNQVMNSASASIVSTSAWNGLPSDTDSLLAVATLLNLGLLNNTADLTAKTGPFPFYHLDGISNNISAVVQTPTYPSLPPVVSAPITHPFDTTIYSPELLGGFIGGPQQHLFSLLANNVLTGDNLSSPKIPYIYPVQVIPNQMNMLMDPTLTNTQWTSKLTPAPMSLEQMARCHVRIRGMPIDVDIMDILIFLDDHWQNVALHGVHQVFDNMGRPTGEAMIQFVSEITAQLVVEHKNGTIFTKRNPILNTACCVEVSHCTPEELRQLLNTILTFCQSGMQMDVMKLLPAVTSNPLKTMPLLSSSSPGMIAPDPCAVFPMMFPRPNLVIPNNTGSLTGIQSILPITTPMVPTHVPLQFPMNGIQQNLVSNSVLQSTVLNPTHPMAQINHDFCPRVEFNVARLPCPSFTAHDEKINRKEEQNDFGGQIVRSGETLSRSDESASSQIQCTTASESIDPDRVTSTSN